MGLSILRVFIFCRRALFALVALSSATKTGSLLDHQPPIQVRETYEKQKWKIEGNMGNNKMENRGVETTCSQVSGRILQRFPAVQEGLVLLSVSP